MNAATAGRRMAAGDWPPMIWVCLDESSATGTHEFADSVNNGPWGEALTTELIPWLEAHYRMDARASGRFLTGHSVRAAGRRSGCRPATRPSSAAPGRPRPTRATSTISPMSISTRPAPTPIAAPTARRRRWSAIMAARSPRFSNSPSSRPCSAPMAASSPRSTGCSRPRGRTGGRCRCSIARPARWIPEVAAYWRDHYDIA